MSMQAVIQHGYQKVTFDLPQSIREHVQSRNWVELDRVMALETSPAGSVFGRLRIFCEFSQIEFIISIRSSDIEADEDGIWHDDGSRILAFSLSLTFDPEQIEGGVLEIRKRGARESARIPTPDFGTAVVFATGHWGYEHKINRVSRGERIIIAGWCT